MNLTNLSNLFSRLPPKTRTALNYFMPAVVTLLVYLLIYISPIGFKREVFLIFSLFILPALIILVTPAIGLFCALFCAIILVLNPGFGVPLSWSGVFYGLVILTYSLFIYALIFFRFRIIDQTIARGKYYRTLLDSSIHPILLKDESGKITFASASIQNLVGYSQNELIGLGINRYVLKEDLAEFEKFFRNVLTHPAKKIVHELRLVHKNGQIIWMRNDVINLLHDPEIMSIVSSFQDISKQKLLDEQRQESMEMEKKARLMAEKAVMMRDEFLSIASHELKTPLTNILLQLQSTIRRILTQSLANFSGEKLVNSLNIAESQSKRLADMIKDLLNISLLTTGRIDLKPELVDMDQLIRGILVRFKEQIDHEGYKVVYQTTGSVSGMWDSVRIEQCLTNLITNTLKYGNRKPFTIILSSDETQAYIKIKDQGIGIKPQDLHKIFDLFHRTKNNVNKPGLGVGLFISKQIINSHNGDISVESFPGKGSIFTLKLPKNPQFASKELD